MRIIVFVAVVACICLLERITESPRVPQLQSFSTIAYSIAIVVWAFSIRRRITNGTIRRCLLVSAGAFVALFALRLCRYDLLRSFPQASMMLWYLYYIPFTLAPALDLVISLHVYDGAAPYRDRMTRVLLAIEAFLCIIVLTNDLHHLVLTSYTHPDGRDGTTFMPLGYALIAFEVFCTLAAYLILIRISTLSSARRLWFVPLLASSPFVAAWIVYNLNGGASPVLLGLRLYNIQEVTAFLYIAVWESCIQIGLIPSSSGYDTLFPLSHTGAAIMDPDGRVIHRAADHASAPPSGIVQRSKPILDGNATLVWQEDVSTVQDLNERLEEVLEAIESENDLIEQSMRVEAERLSIENRNRLYDSISVELDPQIEAISFELDRAARDAGAQRDCMLKATVLGAYVKRHANLMVLTESAGRGGGLSTDELAYAIRESLEYLGLSGISCGMGTEGSSTLPAKDILAAHAFFETVIESALGVANDLYAGLDARNGLRLSIFCDKELDCGLNPVEADADGGGHLYRFEAEEADAR